MFKKILWMLLLATVPSLAQNAAIQGHSYLGGVPASTSGLKSTNYLDGIIPSATITVYLTGTQNKATIYADGSGTPLANPFTSNAITSVNPGGWIFWAAYNQGYDVVMSGGIAPNTYSTPVTMTDVFSGFTGGSGNCSGVAGYIPIIASGGSGCTDSPADYGVTSAGSFTFTPPNDFDITAGGAFSFYGAGFYGVSTAGIDFTDTSTDGVDFSTSGNTTFSTQDFDITAGGQVDISSTADWLLSAGGNLDIAALEMNVNADVYFPEIASGTCTSGLALDSGGKLVTVSCSSGGSSAFADLTSGTNTTAAMVIGSGASLAPTGTGTIQATDIASTIAEGTNVTITGSGTVADPYTITSSATASTAFSALTGSTNTSAAMLVGTGASLGPTGTGTVAATSVGGITVTGTPSTGEVLTATSDTAADWEAGGGSGPTIETNGSSNSSQSLLNMETSTANAVGLTITPSNPSGGIEKWEITGGSYTGNAATATNLASYPTLCSGGQFSQGLSSGSNNCATPSGSSGISGLTAGYVPLAGSATTITGDSALDDGVTTASTITSTEPIAVAVSGGQGGTFDGTEGTAPSATSGHDILYADSTNHCMEYSANGGSFACLSTGGSSGVSSFTGDGVLLSNSASTGAVTATLATHTANTVLAGPTTGSAATPTFRALVAADLPAALSSSTSVNGTSIPSSVTLTQTIASGTATLGTSAIASATCATVVTVTATGVASTDAISWNPNASIKAVTGYTPSTSGGLTIAAYPSSGNVNFDVCNWTGGSITPGAVTLNWRVVR